LNVLSRVTLRSHTQAPGFAETEEGRDGITQ
jgi:hypothetical protein